MFEWFDSVAEELSRPGAPAPMLPQATPYWMVTRLQAIYSQAMNCEFDTRLTPDGQLTFEKSSSFDSTDSMPTAASPASVSSLDTRDQKSKAKVPRPANAFILYRQYKHAGIKAQFPGIINNDICKSLPLTEAWHTFTDFFSAKKIAALWKDESDDVKAIFKAKADAAKQKHLKDHPDYSYQPRKPSEKKRRMTKHKMAKTTAAVVFVDNNSQHVQTPQQPLPAFTLDNRDLSFMTCNVTAMGDNAVEAIDTLDKLVDSVVFNPTPYGAIDFAATNDLTVGLTFSDIQPVGFEELNIFNSDALNGVNGFMDANFAPVSATGAGAMGPAVPLWENRDNHGFMMTADQVQNQQFLNSADAKDLEQDRQELLLAQSQDWAVWREDKFY